MDSTAEQPSFRLEDVYKRQTLDSKAPSASYRDFLMSEVRYNALTRSFPERAELLFTEAEEFAMDKYQQLVKLAQG